ncbi:MAG: DUF3291 domain-containing protein [bacterium]|nr:DUF3291 domain-containing protein [bacterium]
MSIDDEHERKSFVENGEFYPSALTFATLVLHPFATGEPAMPDFVIAEFNIAQCLAPLDDPIMADFMKYRDQVNKLAEDAPGFVWRLTDEGDTSTHFGEYDDPYLIVNLSVWESIDALHQYTYYTFHADMYRRRAEWFGKIGKTPMVLWWVERGHHPTAAEGKARLDYLNAHGASPFAFTFKQRFPAPVTEA